MFDVAAPTCPRCQAVRIDAPECPRCGVIYAKAAARVAPLPTFEPPHAQAPPGYGGELEDARLELKIRAIAIPATLLLVQLLLASDFVHALARIFLSMWVHELGHATTAWLCGFGAIPGPWFTSISEARVTLVPFLVAAALVSLGRHGVVRHRKGPLVAAVVLLVCQFICTYGLDIDTARALFTFGGDGGGLVLGTVLMASMYAGPDTQVHRGWLRWGFLVIGAVAFVDVVDTWWAAHGDYAGIPFGENEGVGLSDASKLVETHGWAARALIQRYLKLAAACGLALVAAYVAGLVQARAEVRRLSGDRAYSKRSDPSGSEVAPRS